MSKRCPICEHPTDPAYAPFCCKRCADIDLQRWFSGAYALPALEQDAPSAPLSPSNPMSESRPTRSGQAGGGYL